MTLHDKQKPVFKQESSRDDIKSIEQDASRDKQSKIETRVEERTIERWENNLDKQRMQRSSRKSVLFASIIVSTVALMGVAGIILLSPSLLLVNMKEQLTNDLNDSMGVYHVFAHKVLAEQIGGDSCEEEKIQCKFGTMSEMLKKRFEDYKFKVNAGEKNEQGRYAVSSVQSPNGETISNGSALQNLVKKDDGVRYHIYNVLNPKNGLFHDRKFPDRLYDRFHLEHRPIVSGYTIKEVGESFGEALKRKADYIDANGRGVYGLHYLTSDNGKKQWQEKIRDRLMNMAKPTHQILACSLYTYAELAENAVRNAKATTLARFAMQYMALADAIKSGNSSSFEATLNTITDRLTVANRDGKNALDESSYRIPAKLEDADSGKLGRRDRNYMNDPKAMLDALRNNKMGPDSPGSEYMRGVMSSLDNSTNDIYKSCIKGISGEQENDERSRYCGYDPAALLAGYIDTGAGLKFSLKKLTVKEPCEQTLESIVTEVRDAIRDTVSKVIPDKMVESARTEADYFTYLAAGIETEETAKLGVGVATQDAIFAGTGIILGDVAQSIGMRPATKSTLGTYYKELASKNILKDLEGRQSVDDKFQKFTASIVRSIYAIDTVSARIPTWSPRTVLASIPRLAGRALASINNTTVGAVYSQPINMTDKRFLTMKDCSLEGDFIDPDFGCNIRYSMSKKDMGVKIKDMLDYMTEAHPDEAEESLNQVNERNTSADNEVGGRMKREAEEGANAPYIDPKTGKPNPHTQYAKFLEFCVNRVDPWGSVGMALEHVEEDYTPDEEDPISEGNPRVYSGEYIKYIDKEHEETELPFAYYGRAWGSEVDQKWMTGEKCIEDSDMMSNFRAYTASCRVLAGLSGARECWHDDSQPTFHSGFYSRNDIIFTREN